MDIKGYKYITHKLIPRPWGAECRFTVARLDGTLIDNVVAIPDMKILEEDLAVIILADVVRIDAPGPALPPDPVEEARNQKEAEVQAFLVLKGLLTSDQTVWDVKTKEEYLTAKVDRG